MILKTQNKYQTILTSCMKSHSILKNEAEGVTKVWTVISGLTAVIIV
jgi:hypothetical protein